jgi:Kef-type K+ transport system membrane component KefB
MAINAVQIAAEAVADTGAVLLLGAALAPVFRRLRQPRVIAEIVVGIMLGPSLLGLLPGDPTARLFPAAVRADLSAMSELSILLFMFLIGWEMDLTQIRARRAAVLGISLSSITLPLCSGIALAMLLYRDHRTVAGHHIGETGFVLFVGTAMAITAFPVLARIVSEHQIQDTVVGALALASAAIGDVMAWCLLAVVSVVAASGGSSRMVELAGWCALYAAVLVLIIRPLMRTAVTRLSRAGTPSPFLLAILAAGVFFSGFVTQLIGLDAIFGAFSFGLVMPSGSRTNLAEIVREPMGHISALLLPVFFISTGLSVNIRGLGLPGLGQLAAIVAVACASKLMGGFAAARVSGLPAREAASIGVLMNARGLTELIFLNVGMSIGVLDGQMFTMMVMMALVTTGMAGPLVPYRSHARADAELDVPNEVARAASLDDPSIMSGHLTDATDNAADTGRATQPR